MNNTWIVLFKGFIKDVALIIMTISKQKADKKRKDKVWRNNESGYNYRREVKEIKKQEAIDKLSVGERELLGL